jgi:RNA polymerase sigma factor (sigma-70 family)
MAAPPGPPALLARARAGDQAGWNGLVDRYQDLIHSITRAHRLSPADAADVYQITWMRLFEHLNRIENPERLGAWLATTARRECLRIHSRSGRQVLIADEAGFQPFEDHVEPVDQGLLRSERITILRRALEMLPERCQRLLRAMMREPPPSYEEISMAFGMPIGAIGPTRGRCLARLRRHIEECGYQRED